MSNVNQWLTNETESNVKSLNEQAKKLLQEIHNRLDELYESSEKLLEDAEKEMARGSRKTFRRAKFLFKLSGSFMDLIDKVIIPEEINGKTLEETSEQLTKTMETINQEKNKWFRALAPYFILTRRRFEASFRRAEDPYKQFKEFMLGDYAKVKRIENISPQIEVLQQSLIELNQYDAAKKTRTENHELLEKQIAKTQQDLQTLQNKGELIELATLKSNIDDLTKSVKHELRHLEKPMVKFQTLVNNPGYSLAPDAFAKLEQYLVNPFEALATEIDGYPLLKTILQKIDVALDNNKMKLKPSRLHKAKDQINRIITKDVLGSLQFESKKFLQQKRELLSTGAIGECNAENAQLQDCLKDLQTKKSLLEAKDARLSKENAETFQRVEQQKIELENIVSSVVGQKVKITFD